MIKFNLVHCGLFAAAVACGSLVTACDRVVEEKSKTTETPNGTSVQKETVVQHNDGSVSVDKESHTDKP